MIAGSSLSLSDGFGEAFVSTKPFYYCSSKIFVHAWPFSNQALRTWPSYQLVTFFFFLLDQINKKQKEKRKTHSAQLINN